MWDLFKVKDITYTINVCLNHCRTKRYGLDSLSYHGAHLLNLLPNDMKKCKDLDIFKAHVIERRDYFVALTVFKCIRGMAPTYISDCITICNEDCCKGYQEFYIGQLINFTICQSGYFKEFICVPRPIYMECPSSRY